MEIDLQGKSIVVTGAARGIGRAIALGLGEAGARVGVLARDRTRAQAVADELAAAGAPEPLALEADLADEAQVAAAAAEVTERWGRLDGLVNNAGRMLNSSPVLDLELDALRRTIDANYVSAVLATKHFAPLMIASGGGRIIYISSIAGVAAGPGASSYGGMKAALNLLSNVVHHELSDQGIRTVTLAPGLTESPGMREITTKEYRAKISARYPGGRIGQPEDVVPFTTFLCSDHAEHLSGTDVTIRPAVNR